MLPVHSFRGTDFAYADQALPRWVFEQVHTEAVKYSRQSGHVDSQACNIIWNTRKIRQMEPSTDEQPERHGQKQSSFKSGQGTAQQKPQDYSFTSPPGQAIKLGTMQLYGKCMNGQSVRVDAPFQISFLWRFPRSFTRDHCFQVWHAIRDRPRSVAKFGQQNLQAAVVGSASQSSATPPPVEQSEPFSLSSCVYYVEYVDMQDAQRFDFNRKHPYLRLVFLTKQDMNQAKQWLTQFNLEMAQPDTQKPDHANHVNRIQAGPMVIDDVDVDTERMLTREYLGLPHLPSPEWKILLFETRIKPDSQWNRQWGNPNFWMSVAEYMPVDSQTHAMTTTCDIHVLVTHPSRIQMDRDRLDLPPLIVEVWDLETRGLNALSDPNFKILTSSSLFFQIGGMDTSGANGQQPVPLEPKLLSFECLTWQKALSIPGIDVVYEETEQDMLIKLVERRRKMGTDVLVTHNGIGFDIVVQAQRNAKLNLDQCKALGKDLRETSRARTKGEGGDSMGVNHAGIIHIDTLVFYKAFYNAELKSKSLKSILEHFFDNETDKENREELDKARDSISHKNALIRELCQRLEPNMLINSKQDVHFSEIPPMFFSGDPKVVMELLEYNATDVFQTARLVLRHHIVLMTFAFCKIFEITGNVYYSQGAEIKCMSRLWRLIYELQLVYNVYEFPEDDPFLYAEYQFGALIQEAIEGIWRGMAALDVKSMYPSMILEYVLCKATMIEKRFLSPQDLAILGQQWQYRTYPCQGRELLVVDGQWSGMAEGPDQSSTQSPKLLLANTMHQQKRQLEEVINTTMPSPKRLAIDNTSSQDTMMVTTTTPVYTHQQKRQLDETAMGNTLLLPSPKQQRTLIKCKSFVPSFQKDLKVERSKYKKEKEKAEETGNAVMQALNDGAQQGVKVLMNAAYGLNGQQGTWIWALADMKNASLEELRTRMQLYQEVAKDLIKKKDDQSKQCFYLYTAMAETLKQMIRLWQQIEQLEGPNHRSDQVSPRTPRKGITALLCSTAEEAAAHSGVNSESNGEGSGQSSITSTRNFVGQHEPSQEDSNDVVNPFQDMPMLMSDEEPMVTQALPSNETRALALLTPRQSPKSKLPSTTMDLASLRMAFQRKAKQEIAIRKRVMQVRNHGGYWPFFPMGALICHLGREYITETKSFILQSFPGALNVFGHTDSLFFDFDKILKARGYDREKAQHEYEVALYELAKHIEHQVNEYWKPRACQNKCLEIEMEAIFRIFVMGDSKKYYFGMKLTVLRNKETGEYTIEEDKLKITGIEMKSRNMAKFLRRTQANIIHLTAANQMPKAVQDTRDAVIQLARKQVPFDDLILYNNLNQDPHEMTNLSASAAVALQNEEDGSGMARRKEEVSYVFVVKPGCLSNNLKTSELSMSATKAKRINAQLNYQYYLHRHIKNPLIKLLKTIEPQAERLFDQWVAQAQNKNISSMFKQAFSDRGQTDGQTEGPSLAKPATASTAQESTSQESVAHSSVASPKAKSTAQKRLLTSVADPTVPAVAALPAAPIPEPKRAKLSANASQKSTKTSGLASLFLSKIS